MYLSIIRIVFIYIPTNELSIREMVRQSALCDLMYHFSFFPPPYLYARAAIFLKRLALFNEVSRPSRMKNGTIRNKAKAKLCNYLICGTRYHNFFDVHFTRNRVIE